ncbi:hypothetical protein ANN_12879 [Periplaneta americana]|uniref:HTH psq-type domain-containing protein n=1 Tax=Periplaneta americana TaxID=6978 RepID=A0ABQ8THS8_PERAM|nr:hypothetical protein ANN_12879 [Periplaneta americana]
MNKSPSSRAVGENLVKAVADVKAGLSYRKAAEKYGISKSTIERYTKGRHTGKFGRPYVLHEEDENILTDCIEISSDWGFPLTAFDICLIVKSFLDQKGMKEKKIPE